MAKKISSTKYVNKVQGCEFLQKKLCLHLNNSSNTISRQLPILITEIQEAMV